jgi:hypothetical protein
MSNFKKLNIRNKSIFISDINKIDDKFILFHKSFSTINTNRPYPGPNKQVLYELKDNRIKIMIDGEYMGHYYTHYYYTNGIYKLLDSDDYDKYRFNITYSQIANQTKIKLLISLYIDKYYLLDLYDKNTIPEILSLIVSGKDNKLTLKESEKDISRFVIYTCKNVKTNKLKCEKYLKINLYNYQKNNILWMENVERNIDKKLNTYQFVDHSGYTKYYIESIGEILYFDNNFKMHDISQNKKAIHNITLNGGVLCDEVGLGKTLSFVSLILQNPKDDYIYPEKKRRKKKAKSKKEKQIKDVDDKGNEVKEINLDNEKKKVKEELPKSKATLIICPNRLCRQWLDEIDKYIGKFDLKILTVLSITQYKKWSLEDYLDADVVITGFTFMSNERYLDTEESTLRFDEIMWHRIIVDEGHELLIDKEMKRQKQRQQQETLYALNATNKWISSGTPLGEPEFGFPGILKFLSNDYDKKYKNLLCDHSIKLIQNYFRHNSKESIKQEVQIPPVIENVKFLKQTKIEKAIYNSARGNEHQMIQLCTHVLVSEYDIILNDELNLEKLQKIMIKHFGDKIKKVEKRIDNLNSQKKGATNTYNKKIKNIGEELVEKKNDNIEKNKKGTKNKKDLDDKYNKKIDACKKKLKDKLSKKVEDNTKNKIKKLEDELFDKKEEINDEAKKLKKEYETLVAMKKAEKAKLTNDNKIKIEEINGKISVSNSDLSNLKYKFRVFDELDDEYEELDKKICPITKCEIDEPVITICGHYFDKDSIEYSLQSIGKWCPVCKTPLEDKEVYPVVKEESTEEQLTSINMYGTKMAYLIKYLNALIATSDDNRIIVFTQWEKMLKLVGQVLDSNNIKYVTIKGNAHVMANRIRQFKLDKEIKIILLSSDKCSSGSNLTEASHIVLLDTLNETKANAKAIEEQAIGRAARIGQDKSVQVLRVIMEDTIEHEYYIRNMK